MTGMIAGIMTALFGVIAIALAALIFLVTGSLVTAVVVGLIFFGIARLLIAFFWVILLLALAGLVVYAFRNREILAERLKLNLEDHQENFRQQADAVRTEREERARREEASKIQDSELPHYTGGVVEETSEGIVIDAEEVK